MSEKPETVFERSVHNHLPVNLYRLKTHNPYISGPADMYYSGMAKAWWIEYKFEKLPVRDSTMVQIDCSEIQLQWLRGRHNEGRNIAVIVGCKEGGVLFLNREWETPLVKAEFVKRMMTRKQLAEWIVRHTGGPPP